MLLRKNNREGSIPARPDRIEPRGELPSRDRNSRSAGAEVIRRCMRSTTKILRRKNWTLADEIYFGQPKKNFQFTKFDIGGVRKKRYKGMVAHFGPAVRVASQHRGTNALGNSIGGPEARPRS
jgi:hypothetical protein